MERYAGLSKKLTARAPPTRLSKIEVTIERLELKNKVGFGKADELYCELESSLRVFANSSSTADSRVRTFSKNIENMSPLVGTSARVILMQCLQQHASEVVDSMGELEKRLTE